MKIELTGYKEVIGKLQTRNNNLKVNSKRIFEMPLAHILEVIRSLLKRGTVQTRHVYDGLLLESVGSESTTVNTIGGFRTVVKFGYLEKAAEYKKHGFNFEKGIPRTVSLPQLRRWSTKKQLKYSDEVLKNIRRTIETNPREYPLITSTWEQFGESNYLVEVHNRVKNVWKN